MKWTKIIILCCIFFITGCRKMEVRPEPPVAQDIFGSAESTVSNGDDIYFNLKTADIYTLTMVDENQQIITREKFSGQVGINKKKIYTRTLPVKYLYLVLEDQSHTQIGKTTIKIN